MTTKRSTIAIPSHELIAQDAMKHRGLVGEGWAKVNGRGPLLCRCSDKREHLVLALTMHPPIFAGPSHELVAQNACMHRGQVGEGWKMISGVGV